MYTSYRRYASFPCRRHRVAFDVGKCLLQGGVTACGSSQSEPRTSNILAPEIPDRLHHRCCHIERTRQRKTLLVLCRLVSRVLATTLIKLEVSSLPISSLVFAPTKPSCCLYPVTRLGCPFSRCAIPDTVVFDATGVPVDWFFTSQREGCVKRKLTRCGRVKRNFLGQRLLTRLKPALPSVNSAQWVSYL